MNLRFMNKAKSIEKRNTLSVPAKPKTEVYPKIQIKLRIYEATHAFDFRPISIHTWGPRLERFGVDQEHILQLVGKEAVATFYCPDERAINMIQHTIKATHSFDISVRLPLLKGIHLMVYEKGWPNQSARVCMREYPNREDGSGNYIAQFDPALRDGNFLTLLREDVGVGKELFSLRHEEVDGIELGRSEVMLSRKNERTVLIMESPEMAKRLYDDLRAGKTNTLEVSGPVKAAVWSDPAPIGKCFGHKLENLPPALNSAFAEMGARAVDYDIWEVKRTMKQLATQLWPELHKHLG